ncbi:MAG: hypothetical protein GX444_03310 [Myxococcales bacterium]|nr:hypothetical protein [Myxococcales bacterium]
MRRGRLVAGLVLLSLVGVGGLMAFPWAISPSKAEELAKRFVLDRMSGPNGGILTNCKVRRLLLFPIFDPADLLASGVLSETIGLAMQYAVLADDRPFFDKQLQFARQKMLGPQGLFYWKVSYDGELVAGTSAVIDDLRIVGAALQAAEKWGDAAYRSFADDIAGNIWQYEVVGGVLRDFLNWRDYGDPVVADTLQLSYIEIPTLRALAKRAPEWQPILEQTGRILLAGRMASGLFYENYNFAEKRYMGDQQNMINQLYCALFAAELEQGDHPFAEWLRNRFAADGVLYAQYDGSGQPLQFFESTSVYALAARYAFRIGDRALGESLLAKLLEFQNVNPISPMYGGFSDDEVYSFDNLEALLTLRRYNAEYR